MLARAIFFALFATVSAIKLHPSEGFMHPWDRDSLENEDGEVDLHAAIDESDAPDPTSYGADEDEALEVANEHALNWKRGHEKIKVVHSPEEDYDNRDLW